MKKLLVLFILIYSLNTKSSDNIKDLVKIKVVDTQTKKEKEIELPQKATFILSDSQNSNEKKEVLVVEEDLKKLVQHSITLQNLLEDNLDTELVIPLENIDHDTFNLLIKILNGANIADNDLSSRNKILLASDYLDIPSLTKEWAKSIIKREDAFIELLNSEPKLFTVLIPNLDKLEFVSVKKFPIEQYLSEGIEIDPEGNFITAKFNNPKNEGLVIINTKTDKIIYKKKSMGSFFKFLGNPSLIIAVDDSLLHRNQIVAIEADTGKVIKHIKGKFNAKYINVNKSNNCIVAYDEKLKDLVSIDLSTWNKRQFNLNQPPGKIEITPDGNFIIYSINNKKILIIDFRTGKIDREIDLKYETLASNNNYIAIVRDINLSKIPRFGAELIVFDLLNNKAKGLKVIPQILFYNSMLLSSSPDNFVLVQTGIHETSNTIMNTTFNYNQRKTESLSLTVNVKEIRGKCLNPDNRFLYFIGYMNNQESNFFAVDLNTWKPIQKIKGNFTYHTGQIKIDGFGETIAVVEETENKGKVINLLKKTNPIKQLILQNLYDLNDNALKELSEIFTDLKSEYEIYFGKASYNLILSSIKKRIQLNNS